ncbi:CD81 protein-like [Anopheles funestus]|uniref:Tetraspanin n=1 Tax=Anopheles funestus TaxID=62324 RepID=A0A182RMT3_ANOFN|nr:CD81 protein-like [Anopheles funestus]
MAIKGCCSVVKYLVVLVNLLFWVVGFLIVSLAIWMLSDPTFLISMTQNEKNYTIGLYIFLTVGGLMLIVAFLGCCGAFKESQWMLTSFFCCLLMVLVAELAAGAWAFQNSSKLDNVVRSAVKEAVQTQYGVIPTRTATLDAIQKHYKCCGAEGPNDWQSSAFNNLERPTLSVEISNQPPSYKVPETCCVANITPEQCKRATHMEFLASMKTKSDLFVDGCMEKLVKAVQENLKLISYVGAAIVGIELLTLILSLLLCCAIRRNDNYKH